MRQNVVKWSKKSQCRTFLLSWLRSTWLQLSHTLTTIATSEKPTSLETCICYFCFSQSPDMTGKHFSRFRVVSYCRKFVQAAVFTNLSSTCILCSDRCVKEGTCNSKAEPNENLPHTLLCIAIFQLVAFVRQIATYIRDVNNQKRDDYKQAQRLVHDQPITSSLSVCESHTHSWQRAALSVQHPSFKTVSAYAAVSDNNNDNIMSKQSTRYIKFLKVQREWKSIKERSRNTYTLVILLLMFWLKALLMRTCWRVMDFVCFCCWDKCCDHFPIFFFFIFITIHSKR